ncbi:MAG: hypothetical protein K2K60_03055 [Clostridia bacterium]|nr:hypothetical protein [Clostridia bacterium]
MLSAQEIANYLTEGLDAIATERPGNYQFSILAETAKGYDGKRINGMVKTYSVDSAPIPSGYTEMKYVFIVQMFISGATNRRYINVNNIINAFIKANQDTSVKFDKGEGIVTFTAGVPQGYKVECELGEGVPLTFTVSVTYTENAVTSGDKHWLLDGVEIPFLSESVYVEREGMTRKLFTDVYSKTLVTGQTKFYSFQIPYESTVFKVLQTEILNASTADGTKHTLTYYDGAAFTQETPFTSTVRIYKSAKSSSSRPDGSVYEVTFADVYDSAKYSHKYYISLIDFPFDMEGDDTRYFSSTDEQTAYFEDKAAHSSAPFIEIQAPNLDNLIITKQVYGIVGSGLPNWTSQFDYASKNYAIIKVVSAERTFYFYYFITNSTIGADGYILVDLKMDTVQTYFFKDDISFSDCLIERAHLNRFVPADADNFKDATTVKFVTNPASKIYNSEEGWNFPKRLVERKKLSLMYLKYDDLEKNKWLNENIAYWVYIFIDPTHGYRALDSKNNPVTLDGNERNAGRFSYFDMRNPFIGATNVISYPVYIDAEFDSAGDISKCKNIIRFKNDANYNFIPSIEGKEAFESLNADKSYYYSIKISMLPPFDTTNIGKINIDNNNNLVIPTKMINHISTVLENNNNSFVGGIKTTGNYGVFFGSHQWTSDTVAKSALQSYKYELPENKKILISEITTQQTPNPAYNPKLNGQSFKELVVTASSGDEFAYDIQKLNESSITFEYSEPIQPEITKYYLRVKGGTGLYAKGTDENYTGLVGSTDTSLAFANDQYAAFIANNKNFYLQSNMKIATNHAKAEMQSQASAAKSIVGGDYVGGITSAVTGKITNLLNTYQAVVDRSLTIDNMKNAPDQLKNANGNVIFNMFCTDLGLYVEKYSALEGDLKTANDFMNLYGFSFNSVANVKDYKHIRKYHNYIKAQLQSINGNLSNIARSDLRQRFAQGIRFWNSDTVSYQHENYELELES